MAQKGFRLRVTLRCVGVVIMVKWEKMEECGGGELQTAFLLEQRWAFTAMSFISEVGASWTFGGVLNRLAGNHRGRASLHTE